MVNPTAGATSLHLGAKGFRDKPRTSVRQIFPANLLPALPATSLPTQHIHILVFENFVVFKGNESNEMSGIEIAGLVFGAFPLLINAVEHYRDMAEGLEVFWRFKREYRLWVHDLKICELAFESNLEALLLPLVADEEGVRKLLRVPGGLGWKNPVLDKRLRERLPKSYSLYLEGIKRVQEIMGQIKDHLGVADNKEPSPQEGGSREVPHPEVTREVGKPNMSSNLRRIKLSLSKFKRESLFTDLTKANNQLRDLLETSDKIASLRQKHGLGKKTKEMKGLWQFWRHADDLYKLLSRSWCCECRQHHQVNLLLQRRTCPTPEFEVLFHYGRHLAEGAPLWTFQEVQIRITELPQAPPGRRKVVFAEDSTSVKPPGLRPAETAMPALPQPRPRPDLSTPPPMPSPASGRISPRQAMRSVKASLKKGLFSRRDHSDARLVVGQASGTPVALTLPEQSADTSSDGVVAPQEDLALPQLIITNVRSNETSQPTTSAPPSPGISPVANLCAEMPKLAERADDEPTFYIEDGACRASIHPVRYDSLAITPHRPESTTLATLLSKDTPRPLTRRERYLLALTLAASYLQLKSSPWIRIEWSKKDIIFINPGATSPAWTQLDRPYVEQRLDHTGTRQPGGDQGHPNTTTAAVTNNRDRTLASLGIMLLELCFGTALEEHEIRKRYMSIGGATNEQAASNPFFDMAAALEWSAQVAEEAGPEFAEAVEWCLKNMPGSGKSDGTPDKWREELFEKVVMPLQYCCDQFA